MICSRAQTRLSLSPRKFWSSSKQTMRLRPTALIRAVRLLSIAALRVETAVASRQPQTLWPPRSIGPRTRLTHVFPLPPSNPRAAPGFALALRTIRHPDACERLPPLVALFWIKRREVVVLLLTGASHTRAGLYSLYVIVLLVVLLLEIWRPIRKIPADAETGDINARSASQRSLSGTHFAQQGSAARLKMGGVAAPPGPTARRLAGLSGSLAPLAQRAIKGVEECETANADSHPVPPTPEGR